VFPWLTPDSAPLREKVEERHEEENVVGAMDIERDGGDQHREE
jgi:hypothetical protein